MCVFLANKKNVKRENERENERSERVEKAETKNNHDREKLFAREKKKSKKRDKNSLFFTLDQLEVFGVLQ